MRIASLFRKLKLGVDINIPLPSEYLESIRNIKVRSKRSYKDIVRVLAQEAIASEGIDKLLSYDYLDGRSQASFSGVRITLPKKAVLSLQDACWQARPEPHRGAKTWVPHLLGASICTSIKQHGEDYWSNHFLEGVDVLDLLTKEILFYERKARKRNFGSEIGRHHYRCVQDSGIRNSGNSVSKPGYSEQEKSEDAS